MYKGMSVKVMAAMAILWMPVLAQAKVDQTTANPYAEYIKARMAVAEGDMRAAARGWIMAAKLDPTNSSLQEQAFFGALINGDIGYASSFRPKDDKAATQTLVFAQLTQAVKALYDKAPKKALAALQAALALSPGDRTALMLRPWVLAQTDNWDEALLYTPPQADLDRGLSLLLRYQKAQLLEVRGRNQDAETLYRELYPPKAAPSAATVFFGPEYAAFLERRGRGEDAIKIYETLLSIITDPEVLAHLNRTRAGGPAPRLKSLEESTVSALVLTAQLYMADKKIEPALINLRMSLYLTANNDELAIDKTRLLVSQLLLSLRDTKASEAELRSISPSSLLYAQAQTRLASSLRLRDAQDEALAIYETLAKSEPQNTDYLLQRSDIYLAKNEPQKALGLIDAYTQTYAEQDFSSRAYYLKALIHNALGDWRSAEVAIRRAKSLDETAPDILNFLGYGLIESKQDVQEGIDLIKQALRSEPRSGAIMDSLGWGYYQIKDYDQALEWIEKAVELEPAVAEINDHLGDVYQALGRVREARYQWERVLTLKADEKYIQAVKQKLNLPSKVATQDPSIRP
jgi:tetratricopeptide (TPR) repeat protein